MAVWIVFFISVFISGTIPLAIKWSQQGPGLFFSVTLRMMIGLAICLGLLLMTRTPLPLGRRAIYTYLIGGMGFFAGISCSYWGLQFLPSGWTSVLFGLSPIFSGLIARRVLSEPFGWNRVVGSMLGLAGLFAIFFQSSDGDVGETGVGVVVTVVSVVVFSLTTVLVKKIGKGISPVSITFGGLVVMTPCFFIAWSATEGVWPAEIPLRSLGAIVYLAVFATVIGFVAYYYLLGKVDASVAGLPNFLAPLMAVWLGVVLNGERLQPGFLVGAAFILSGLSLFQWGVPVVRKVV